jgi:hypothetical protein
MVTTGKDVQLCVLDIVRMESHVITQMVSVTMDVKTDGWEHTVIKARHDFFICTCMSISN